MADIGKKDLDAPELLARVHLHPPPPTVDQPRKPLSRRRGSSRGPEDDYVVNWDMSIGPVLYLQQCSMTHLVAERELVVRVGGRVQGRDRGALDVVDLAPGASHARHHGGHELHKILRRVNQGRLARPEGARDAARLLRLVPLRVEGDLRRAQGILRRSGELAVDAVKV